MKRIVSLLFIFVSVFCYADSVQQGCVKTRGRMINGKHVPGQGLPGSIVSIKDRTAIGVKNSNGTFSFPVTDNQFRVDSVKKKDYVLLDADAASKTYTHTADTLFFVMETPEQILQDKLATERRLRRSLQAKLQAREEELDSLIALQQISQEEYQQSLQQLYAEQSENDKLISDMAERYSTLDYDQMDEFYRQVSYYIEQCEFVKADSLLKTRGNLHAQLEAAKQQGKAIQQEKEQLQKAEKVHQHDIDELAKRCYSYFENFKMQHQNDSAAYYLEQRVQLDTTNTQWIDELADFLQEYLAQYDKALKYYQQSLAIKKQLFGESHPYAVTLKKIGFVYKYQGNFIQALEYFKMSLSISKNIYGLTHPNVANAYNAIGLSYHYLGDYSQAMKYYENSLNIYEKLLDNGNPDIATVYGNIGIVYINQGNYTLGQEYCQKSLLLYKKILGNEHHYTANAYNNVGFAYHLLGNYSQALEYYEKSLHIYENIYGHNHLYVAGRYINIGIIHYNQGNHTLALEYYQKSLCIYEKFLIDDHPDIANVYGNIGTVYNAQGNYTLALEYYQKSLCIYEKFLIDNHPSLARVYYNIGVSYYNQGDYSLALEYYYKVLSIRKEHLGIAHPETKKIKDKIETLKEKMSVK